MDYFQFKPAIRTDPGINLIPTCRVKHPFPRPAFLECLALFPGGIQAFCHKGLDTETALRNLAFLGRTPLSSPKSDDRHSALCTTGYNEVHLQWCSKQKGKTSHALKQQDSSTVWRELSEITVYGLLTLQMDEDPNGSGHLLRSLGLGGTQPLCGGFSSCHPSHLSPLACQRTAGPPFNESPDLCRLGPISTKLFRAAKCPASPAAEACLAGHTG